LNRGDGADLLIHSCPKSRRQALLQTLAGFDADCVATQEQQQAQKLPVQDRESL
jgi:hypothetical protein